MAVTGPHTKRHSLPEHLCSTMGGGTPWLHHQEPHRGLGRGPRVTGTKEKKQEECRRGVPCIRNTPRPEATRIRMARVRRAASAQRDQKDII
uniref:Uncharacterized protein n=1 Tax=Rousettus aegyptiacus TaxID=9407 RepID=A0A7J8E8F0_ROUAE|nr:hypothetical protein HJG63_008097 [Rousettus aegyptiacus]